MVFFHCIDCGATTRSLRTETLRPEGLALDPVVLAFNRDHAGCRVTHYVPTGRAESTQPWHEPMAERRLEVCNESGIALAVGTRASLDEPLCWTLSPIDVEERLDVDLDRDAFWNSVDRALRPHHVPVRAVSAWAERIQSYVRRVPPDDLVLLWDDPSRPNVTQACLTLTSRVLLESSLSRIGLDEESERRLLGAFEDPEFPLLAVKRTLTDSRSSP